MRCLLLCLAFSALGQPPADDVSKLSAIRERVLRQLSLAAQYTCVETIQRSHYRAGVRSGKNGCAGTAAKQPPTLLSDDRLRLDVAVSGRGEIFSWHGESQFQSGSISNVVEDGPISSGGFIGFLHNIFTASGVRFTLKARETVDTAPELTFDYSVPRASSSYDLLDDQLRVRVAYHGQFRANASTSDLTSLTVFPDGIPPESQICSTNMSIQYRIANIAGADLLIPLHWDVHTEARNRAVVTSSAEYSQCRRFNGESTLRFDMDDAPAQAAVSQPVLSGTLPAQLVLSIGLKVPIESASAFVGDPVQGVLRNQIRVQSAGLAIPPGALVEGFITRLEHRPNPRSHFLISIRFTRLIYNDSVYALTARQRIGNGWHQASDVYGHFVPDEVRAALLQSKDGAFLEQGTNFKLDKHFQAEWETTAAPAR